MLLVLHWGLPTTARRASVPLPHCEGGPPMRPTSSRWIVLALLLSLVLAVPFLLGSAAASVAHRARESAADRRAARAAAHRVHLRWVAVQHRIVQQRTARRLAAYQAALTGVRAVAIARRFIGVPY